MGKGCWAVAAVCLLMGLLPASTGAQETAPFTIERFVFCTRLEGLEPADPSDRLPAGNAMIIAFLEARQIAADTSVTFVWIHDGKEVRTMTVELPKGPRWRTFDGKIPYRDAGPWTVELRDRGGRVIRSASFTVE